MAFHQSCATRRPWSPFGDLCITLAGLAVWEGHINKQINKMSRCGGWHYIAPNYDRYLFLCVCYRDERVPYPLIMRVRPLLGARKRCAGINPSKPEIQNTRDNHERSGVCSSSIVHNSRKTCCTAGQPITCILSGMSDIS